jgi:16S rRNA (cytosine1402-N4)-methyltransferase
MANFHEPVLLEETLRLLNCHPGGIYVDGTIGGGGHAYHIFRTCPDIRLLIGIDRDEEALIHARKRLAPFKNRIFLVNGNYSQIKKIISNSQIKTVDGVLLDLGVSTHQLLSPHRGFSFLMDGPLDMRMGKEQKTTASDLINTLPEVRLARILKEYGEERRSVSIARLIVKRRKETPIKTTSELADLVVKAIPFRSRPRKIHPATRTFQALRIAVNDELTYLQKGLADSIDVLAPEGRIAVISFHSLEDRIVKNTFRHHSRTCICPPDIPQCCCGQIQKLRILTKKPIFSDSEEISKNPRSRSARLRGAEKI